MLTVGIDPGLAGSELLCRSAYGSALPRSSRAVRSRDVHRAGAPRLGHMEPTRDRARNFEPERGDFDQMAKRRNIAVTFQAVLEWQRGVARAMNDARPVPLHVMLFGIAATAGGTVSHLADLLGIDIKTCSRLLKTVRERGWATVEQDTKDERQRRVMLTEDGKSVVQLMHGALVDVAFRVVENVAGPQTSATFSSQRSRREKV